MMAKRLRLRLTPQEGLHRDFLMKRAAYLMRKTKRALSAYHAAKGDFYPSSTGELEAQIAALTDRAHRYFAQVAEERAALAAIREFDEAARGE